jgi:hypothetical protein
MGRSVMTKSVPINPHQKAYVCTHVFDDVKPILLVSRDDGDWSFLCGEGHEDSASSYRVVGIGHLLDRDPSLQSLLDLPPDWEAERKTTGDAWIRTRCASTDA